MQAAARPLRQDVKVIGLIAGAHSLSHFYQLVIPVLFPLIKADLGVSYAELGAASALFYVVSGVCQTLAGFAVDRFGARRVLIGGLTLCSGGVLLAGLAHAYPMLLVASLVAGVGNSVFHPADFAILNARVDSARLGYAFSFHGIGGNLGWALAPLFCVALSAAWGWHAALLAAASLGIVMIGVLLTQREAIAVELRRPAPDAPAPSLAADVRILTAAPVLMCFFFFFLLSVALTGIQTFGVASLSALYAAPVALASSALTAFLLGGAAGILAGGWVATRTSRHDLVAASGMLAAGVLMLSLALGALTPALLAPVLALAGFCSGATNPSRDLLVRGATPRGSTGKVYGFVYSGLDLGAMVTPVFYGWLLDRGLAQGVFLTVFVALMFTIATVLQLPGKAQQAQAQGVS
jgi:FSR family fosmidomycin resistance protein-like MFS transporter